MVVRNYVIAALVAGSLLSHQAFAAADTPLSSAARQEVVQTLAAKLKANYVLPDVAERIAASIVKKNAEAATPRRRARRLSVPRCRRICAS